MEKVSGGQSFLASIQNLPIFAIFKWSLNLNIHKIGLKIGVPAI